MSPPKYEPLTAPEHLEFSERQLAWIGVAAYETAQRAVLHYARRAAVGFLILALGIAFGFHLYAKAIDGNQASIAKSRALSARKSSAVCRIITRGDAELYAYANEGLISVAQRDRALKLSAESRRDLQPGHDCTPKVTPPPKKLPALPKPKRG